MSDDKRANKLISLIISILAVLLVLNGLMFVLAPRIVFQPIAEMIYSPRKSGLNYEEATLKSGSATLNGWWIPHSRARFTVIFFHGNAGNISHRQATIESVLSLNLNLFIFDYRGFGLSSDTPSESGLYEDAKAAWDYVVKEKNIPENQIILWGRSLGGAVAIDLARKVKAAGLIVESSFSSAPGMANQIFPLLSYVVIPRYRFNNLKKIQQAGSPVLVIHSKDDEMIPFRMGASLFKHAKDPKTFVTINGDHNGGFIQDFEKYQQGIKRYLRTLPSH